MKHCKVLESWKMPMKWKIKFFKRYKHTRSTERWLPNCSSICRVSRFGYKFCIGWNEMEREIHGTQFWNFLDQKNKLQQSEAMDPINALQNLTNQGTRNPMPAQMMNMGNQIGMGNVNPNTNANVLQNLINVSYENMKTLWNKCTSNWCIFHEKIATRWCWARPNATDAKYPWWCAECNGQ